LQSIAAQSFEKVSSIEIGMRQMPLSKEKVLADPAELRPSR
jgi:hypothetical protein